MSLESWLMGLGYAGAFLAGLVGASSIIYTLLPWPLVVFLLGSVLNPILVAVSAGTGASIGQFIHYYIGYAARRVSPEKLKKLMDSWGRRLTKWYGPVLIFLFAASPLPDDLLWIPLGLMKYSKLKAFVPMFLGKVVFMSLIAYFGQLILPYIGL